MRKKKRKMNYKYPQNTQVNIEGDSGSNKRFLLTLDKSRASNNKRVLMIFMNPSKATNTISDRTINNAYKYFTQSSYEDFKGYDGIEVINLIPYYETDSSKLKDLTNSICETNNEYIAKSLLEDRVIILAYGNAPSGLGKAYSQQISYLLSLLEGRTVYHVDHILKTGNLRHACYWQLNMELYKKRVKDGKIIEIKCN